jgi:hypothetical protein
MTKPKVVLIVGSAHGGTTILNMVLGQHPQIFSTGKLRNFPHGDLFSDTNVCSCGVLAKTCPFWTEIREQFRPLQDAPERQKIPRLFEMISRASGLPFVCDVSHNVEYARQLADTDGIDLYLVHVLRDGRGIVHSRIRKDFRIGRLKSSFLSRIGRVFTVSRHWLWHHREFARLEKGMGGKAVCIQYEELCRDPLAALQPVGECLGLNFAEIGRSLGEGQPLKRVAHLIRGNEALRSGSNIVLRHDTAYQTAMSWTDRTIFRLAALLP